jgi:hypothetical protein
MVGAADVGPQLMPRARAAGRTTGRFEGMTRGVISQRETTMSLAAANLSDVTSRRVWLRTRLPHTKDVRKGRANRLRRLLEDAATGDAKSEGDGRVDDGMR